MLTHQHKHFRNETDMLRCITTNTAEFYTDSLWFDEAQILYKLLTNVLILY